MKTLKSSFLILLLMLFSGQIMLGQESRKFNSVEGKCSITFPGEYDIEKEETEHAMVVKIICNKDNRTYFLSYSLHKNELVDHEEMAEVSYDSFVEAVAGEARSKSEWVVQGHQGLKSLIDMPASQALVDYRVVLVGDIQYQLAAIATYDNYDEALFEDFSESFEIKE